MYLDEHMSSRKIAEKYNCWGSTIIYHLKEWDVPIRSNVNNEQYNNTYHSNIHYFDKIDSLEKAYWIGYIAADGHVSNSTLMLACSYVDSDILYKFRSCINSNHPFGVTQDGNPTFSITSKHIVETLNGYGLYHDKTYSMHLRDLIEFIPEKYQHAFFTGLFDGDGSIRFYNYDYVNGFQYHLGFTGLKESAELFAENFHINTKPVNEGNNIYTVRTANAPLIYWCIH